MALAMRMGVVTDGPELWTFVRGARRCGPVALAGFLRGGFGVFEADAAAALAAFFAITDFLVADAPRFLKPGWAAVAPCLAPRPGRPMGLGWPSDDCRRLAYVTRGLRGI